MLPKQHSFQDFVGLGLKLVVEMVEKNVQLAPG